MCYICHFIIHCIVEFIAKKVFWKNYKICLQNYKRTKKRVAQTDIPSQSLVSVTEQSCTHKSQQLTLDKLLRQKDWEKIL